MKKEQGLRYNFGKDRHDLLHPDAIDGLVKVLTSGAMKYAERNWEKGMKWSTVIASLKRHLKAIEKGEDFDKESGLLHIDHIQANAHFLSAYYKIAAEYDDRQHWFKKPIKRLFIDIDGVIAGFDEAFRERYGLVEEPHDWNDHRYIDKLNEIKNIKSFWVDDIKPLIDPKDISYPIAGYCTSRSIDDSWIKEWLNKHLFPNAPVIRLDFGQSKTESLKEAGCDVFIDDSIHNFIDISSGGILCYLATRSHNTKYNVGHFRVDDLLDLIENKLK